jgi:hypothetical protein
VDQELAKSVARSLWILAYWSDERHRAFTERAGRSPIAAFGQQMEGWPVPPVPMDLVADVSGLLTGVERAWGRSVEQVAEEMGTEPESLAYRTLMACIGHGIGPDDDGTFPDGLDPSPMTLDDPADRYTPDESDLEGIPLD